MRYDPGVAVDYSTALIGGGVPSTYHLASALAKGDDEEAMYYAKLEASVLATQYGMLRFLNWMSPKNAISFKELHHGLSFVRSQAITSAPVVVPVVATAAAIGYEKAVNEPLRKAHGGWDIDWFGPFASGFGTVV